MAKLLPFFLTIVVAFSLWGCEKFLTSKKENKAPVQGQEAGQATGNLKKGTVNIAGTYRAQGTNPGGRTKYSGTATLTPDGDKYRVHWEVGTIYDGVGKVEGNIFKVEWGRAGDPVGLVTYTIDSDKVLRGSWYTFKNPNTLGTETLTPQ